MDATEAEIPFVAEVMQVRPAERAVWNETLEKLLHSTGLSLLVPERLYSAVRSYVHEQRDLRGKIVFHRVERKAPPTLPELLPLLQQSPRLLLDNASDWPGLLTICAYF